ncbi:hypothetical protein M513_01337 [Trichuris suis]|uniref:Uncharacterized protein n=1 Tax=Trichuris suis TaxID=68888 RepID=A0A085MKC1_9BILA|nr:hypothetical protein M513_01337 [Trichuris suis]
MVSYFDYGGPKVEPAAHWFASGKNLGEVYGSTSRLIEGQRIVARQGHLTRLRAACRHESSKGARAQLQTHSRTPQVPAGGIALRRRVRICLFLSPAAAKVTQSTTTTTRSAGATRRLRVSAPEVQSPTFYASQMRLFCQLKKQCLKSLRTTKLRILSKCNSCNYGVGKGEI